MTNSLRLALRQKPLLPQKTAVPHVNIVGYPGAKKSSTAKAMARKYGPAVWISRPNTKPRRAGDVSGEEYVYLTNEEYAKLERAGMLWHTKSRMFGSVEFHKGTFAPSLWPQPNADTKVVISMFGPTRSAQIKEEFAPQMTTFCLFGSDLVLVEGIIDRNDRDSGRHHLDTIRRYRRLQIEKQFEHTINTDNLSAEDCADWIAVIVGLEPAIAA